MKAVVLRAGGRLVLEDWPRPAIAGGELLVRLRGCGLCGSDIAKVMSPSAAVPSVLGHELVADVVEVGGGSMPYRVGDRVVVAHHVPCDECHYCRRGSSSMCRTFKTSNLDPGGFAELVRVPAPNVRHATFRVPDGTSDEVASFVEPLACCLRAVRRVRIEPGDTTVIIGAGSIGCLFVQLARRAGGRVVAVDTVAARAGLAQRLGAERVGDAAAASPAILELSDRRGADHVIVTAGGAEVLPWAASAVRDGGAVHYFAGGGGATLPLPLETLYHRELTITATYSSSPADLAEAFRLLCGGEVVVDQLVTHHVPLERLADGLELVRRREALKVFVTT